MVRRGGNDDAPLPDGDPDSILRRSPFSDNPRVGVRGQRAQQRILEAALQVFGDVGYHQCGIVRITEVAGCSRASFYQYFSSKEDVFRHLAGQVARQLMASAEALEPITPDRAGWETVRAWVDRHAQIYARYEPVFQVFHAATESDDTVATGSARILQRTVSSVRAKVTTTTLPARQLDAVIEVLLNCMTRTPYVSELLGSAIPGHDGRGDPARVGIALTDVIHRTLFGLEPEVNARPASDAPWPGVPDRARLLGELLVEVDAVDLTPAGNRTLEVLLSSAQEVLVTRGYHGTRVDDITAAAGLSHGAFYRYFENKDHLVRVVAVRALRHVQASFDEMPHLDDDGTVNAAALRKWLRSYASAHQSEVAMIRVWVDASGAEPTLRLESAAALDWGRSRMVGFLEPRDFGDVEAEALLGVVLLDALGSQRRSPEIIDAGALVIERGLLGTATAERVAKT